MSTVRAGAAATLRLEFPQSLATYDDYAGAQRAVDHLSDEGFPVQHCMIVGTDLKQVERITGRLTTGRVAAGGAMSGLWLGVFVGLVISIFAEADPLSTILSAAAFGIAFGMVWALIGYAATRGRRDFSSVSQVVATKYEVLCEHKHAAQARDLMTQLPGSGPNPFQAPATPSAHTDPPAPPASST